MSILPSAILSDFATQIRGITPAETSGSSSLFAFLRSREQVESSGLRGFTLEIEPIGDGALVGSGNDYQFSLSVVTSYRGLQFYDAQCMVLEDNRQIFQTLALRSGPLSGLQAVTWVPPGFNYENKTDGQVWGSHVFNVRYIAADTP